MQTFLPYSSFGMSAKVLDNKRLGKQRVEVLQILNALKKGGGWVNHPAVKMWRGYEVALENYGCYIVQEWLQRGFENSIKFSFSTYRKLPPWMGNEGFHRSHQSNLLRKDKDHYGQFFKDVPDNLPYVWPVGGA